MNGRPWSPADQGRFADGDRLRAQTIPAKKPLPPAVEEWLDELADDVEEELVDGLSIYPPEDDEKIFLSVTIDVVGPGQARARELVELVDGIDELVDGIEELVGRVTSTPVSGSTFSIGFPAE